MHYGIGAPEKWAPTLESPLLLNIRFSFASVYLSSCLISPSLIHLLPILINYIRLKFQATVSGSFWGKKITFIVVISGQEFLTSCNEFWGVKGVSNLRLSDLLPFWRSVVLLSSTGLESFRKQARTGCSTCLISLPGLYISITRWTPPVSMWLPYFFGLKRQTEMDLQTQPVRRRSVCAPFLQTKQPCSPSKSRRWFGKHLSSIKVVALKIFFTGA